ncbi:hypothetical protein PG996_008265 [Apiospora saccharicola]|uniref:Uncharacterized protein n=1 Tax=Apiospora saccharicola TaxID=335842 RepID=A0ABR1UXF4_9PEZI
MWVWAIDPEQCDDKQEGYDTVQEQEAASPGYMRARLQQLVGSFYVARRSDDGNMVVLETLWVCVQNSYQKAFVSLREIYERSTRG